MHLTNYAITSCSQIKSQRSTLLGTSPQTTKITFNSPFPFHCLVSYLAELLLASPKICALP